MKSLNLSWDDNKFEKMKQRKDKTDLSWESYVYEAIINGRQDNSQRS